MTDLTLSEKSELLSSLDTLDSLDVVPDVVEVVERRRTNFTDLPRDVLQLTLGYLDDTDLAAVCMVNPNFAINICNSRFWLAKLLNRFGIDRYYADLVREDNTYWALYNYLSGTKPIIKEKIDTSQADEIIRLGEKIKFIRDKVGFSQAKSPEQFDRLMVNVMKTIKQIHKNADPRKMRSRATGPVGFNAPILVTENMRQFIRNGNFGPVNPEDPNSPPLNWYLQAGQNGVISLTMLSDLFTLYVSVNNMEDPMQSQYLTSTEEMDKYFQDTYIKIKAKNPEFDEKHFRYMYIPKILFDNTVMKTNLTQAQHDLLNDQATINRTTLDHKLVKRILDVYRHIKEARK